MCCDRLGTGTEFENGKRVASADLTVYGHPSENHVINHFPSLPFPTLTRPPTLNENVTQTRPSQTTPIAFQGLYTEVILSLASFSTRVSGTSNSPLSKVYALSSAEPHQSARARARIVPPKSREKFSFDRRWSRTGHTRSPLTSEMSWAFHWTTGIGFDVLDADLRRGLRGVRDLAG